MQELTFLIDDARATPDRAHAILRERSPLEQELWPLRLPALPTSSLTPSITCVP